MNRAQEQKHLAQATGHIAELKVQIVRQRAIVKYALDTGQPSEMAESLLHALEESLGAFEKHRERILNQVKRRPPRPATANGGPGLATTHEVKARHGQLTNAAACRRFGKKAPGVPRAQDMRGLEELSFQTRSY